MILDKIQRVGGKTERETETDRDCFQQKQDKYFYAQD